MSEVDSQSPNRSEENMAAHAPSPWTAGYDGSKHVVFDAVGWTVATIPGAYNQGLVRRHDADALLIVAAPDMAAALKRALNWLASYPGGCAEGAYMDAVNALKKAGCYD